MLLLNHNKLNKFEGKMTEKNQAFDLKKVYMSIDGFVLDSIPVELARKRPLEEIVVRKLNSKGLELPLMQSSLGIKTKEGSESFSFKPLEQRKPLNSSLFIYFREQNKGSKSLMTQAHYYGYYNYNNIKKTEILRIEKDPDHESVVIELSKNKKHPFIWLL